MELSTAMATCFASALSALRLRCLSPCFCSTRATCWAATGAIWAKMATLAPWPTTLAACCRITGDLSVMQPQAISMKEFQYGTLNSPRCSTTSLAMYRAKLLSHSLPLFSKCFRSSMCIVRPTWTNSSRLTFISEATTSTRLYRTDCGVTPPSSDSLSLESLSSLSFAAPLLFLGASSTGISGSSFTRETSSTKTFTRSDTSWLAKTFGPAFFSMAAVAVACPCSCVSAAASAESCGSLVIIATVFFSNSPVTCPTKDLSQRP
mmetsp:Transcript_47076/g.102527  ORF Transcript_47076/g.102527 Transcript_47076/m.102527 type:complete len:263 (+) Transcript_47076:469-1257(+)